MKSSWTLIAASPFQRTRLETYDSRAEAEEAGLCIRASCPWVTVTIAEDESGDISDEQLRMESADD